VKCERLRRRNFIVNLQAPSSRSRFNDRRLRSYGYFGPLPNRAIDASAFARQIFWSSNHSANRTQERARFGFGSCPRPASGAASEEYRRRQRPRDGGRRNSRALELLHDPPRLLPRPERSRAGPGPRHGRHPQGDQIDGVNTAQSPSPRPRPDFGTMWAKCRPRAIPRGWREPQTRMEYRTPR